MADHAVNEDKFSLLVAGEDVPIASSYRVNSGVFKVPGDFSMLVGHTGLLTELIHNYCEFTPFELRVNDVTVMQGDVTDLHASGDTATQLSISGSDRLWRLTAWEADNDQAFTESTYADLTEFALKECGLGDVSLVSSNLANRKAITGKTKIKESVSPTEESAETELQKTIEQRTKTVLNSLKIESGTTWWDFLTAQYQRGGLFLWADVFGGFVLGQPNGNQSPISQLVRRRGSSGEQGSVNFLGQPEFSRSMKGRYSEFQVFGRKGSGVNGRGTASSRVIDDEIVALLNTLEADRVDGGKLKKKKFYRDDKVKSPSQASFLALRKMAESRRNSFTLNYTISGHTLPALSGGGRLVVQPDTVVHVVDDELGIDGPMYISECDYSRSPKSTTKITLVRPEHLLFGEEDLLAPPAAPANKKGAVRMGRTEVFRPKWKRSPNWGNLPLLNDPNGFDSDRVITPDGIVDASGRPRS